MVTCSFISITYMHILDDVQFFLVYLESAFICIGFETEGGGGARGLLPPTCFAKLDITMTGMLFKISDKCSPHPPPPTYIQFASDATDLDIDSLYVEKFLSNEVLSS